MGHMVSAEIGGFCLLHPSGDGGGGSPIPKLLISLGAWKLPLHINDGGPIWDLEKRWSPLLGSGVVVAVELLRGT